MSNKEMQMSETHMALFPIARNSDPDTSHAAQPSDTTRHTLMKKLLAVLVEGGPMTTEEAAAVAHLDRWQATKRMSDLQNAGQIVDSGDRRRGASGRKQIVWTVNA